MSRRNGEPRTIELLARLPQQIINLAKIEYENAKREVVSKAKSAGIGLGAIVVALFFLFFMLEALVIAAIAALALVWPWWLAALTVAAALLLLAAAAVLGGVWLIKRGNPLPAETLGRLEGDAAALAEVRLNSEADTAKSRGAMPQANEEGNWR